MGSTNAARPFYVKSNGVNDMIFVTPTTASATNILVTKTSTGAYASHTFTGTECNHSSGSGASALIELTTPTSSTEVFRMGLCASSSGTGIYVKFINNYG